MVSAALTPVGAKLLPGVSVLPEPWTPQGLERLSGSLAADTANGTASAPPPVEPAEPIEELPPEEAVDAPPALRPGERPGVGSASGQPPWASALLVEIRQLRESQESLRSSLDLLQNHLAVEDTRKAETIQAQVLEIANLRNTRERTEREQLREKLLRGVFHHRDRLANLLADTRISAPRAGIASVLRALDEYLATEGILTDEDPDPDDNQLCRVVGTRPRTAHDPPADRIVRKPAFYRMAEGQRRVLRPAEIETLT